MVCTTFFFCPAPKYWEQSTEVPKVVTPKTINTIFKS